MVRRLRLPYPNSRLAAPIHTSLFPQMTLESSMLSGKIIDRVGTIFQYTTMGNPEGASIFQFLYWPVNLQSARGALYNFKDRLGDYLHDRKPDHGSRSVAYAARRRSHGGQSSRCKK